MRYPLVFQFKKLFDCIWCIEAVLVNHGHFVDFCIMGLVCCSIFILLILVLIIISGLGNLASACFWNLYVYHQVSLLAHGNINTSYLLQRRWPHISLSPSSCIVCERDHEIVDLIYIYIVRSLLFSGLEVWEVLGFLGLS